MLERRAFLAAAALAAASPLAFPRARADGSLPDMVVGRADAPIEIVEYLSMTCGHCAAFHEQVYPQLKSAWLDTGRARLVLREFPLDRLALQASAVARCAGEERSVAVIDALLRLQQRWAAAADPIAAIKEILRMGGQDPAMVDSCLENRAVIDGILAIRLAAQEAYDIRSTPSFVIDGEVYAGARSFEAFDARLRAIEGEG